MKNKKDTNALLIGLGLIILVMFITFFRTSILSSENQSNNAQQKNPQTEIAGQKYQTISSLQLQKKLALGTELNLLDVRSFKDYITEHLVDSVNVAIDELPVGAKINPKNPVILITTDATDQDSIATVLKSLESEHITNVQILAGGIEEWKKMAGATVNFGNPNSFTDQSKVSYVENAQLNEALKSGVSTFILDVRTQPEYANGHIKGAVNIPLDDLEKRRNEVRTFPRIVLSGASELQEFEAAVQLYDMLLVQPFVLKEGIPGWQKKGFELVK